MKTLLLLLFILTAFMGCVKEEDETDLVCTSGCTTIQGNIITSDKMPLKGVELQLKYVEEHYLASYHSWLKRETTTDANGYYHMSFNIKDDEVVTNEAQFHAYFELQLDFSNLDPDKYILPSHPLENDTLYFISSHLSLKQDTTYNVFFYIPAKDYITVTLNNFKPVQQNDCFKVQTFFPWGEKSDEIVGSNFLNTEYGYFYSGYDDFAAKSENQPFRVPVARSDTNIVRVIRLKNGVASLEDHKIFVPKDNNIELSFEY